MKNDKKKKKPFSLQEQIEWIPIAFVLALTVRCFIVEAYQIPTGSMAPTLYGRHYEVTCPRCRTTFNLRRSNGMQADLDIVCPECLQNLSGRSVKTTARGGDRILVSKNFYLFTRPKRWDVFVFKDPERGEENTNFVKRLVGLPGETVQLRDGQVFINGHIAQKPAAVQRVLWQDVYTPMPSGAVAECWSTAGNWNVRDEGLLLEDVGAGWQTIRYARPIVDFYAYNGRPGRNVVPDILVGGHAVMEGSSGAFAACIWADSDTWRAVFRPAATTLDVELRCNESLRGNATLPVAFPREFDFSLSRADGVVEVAVNGDAALSFEENLTPENTPLYTDDSGVFFQGSGGRLLLRDVTVKRDIYYRADLSRADRSLSRSFVADVPEGHYLGLGDNSPISRDSRVWGFVPEENILGKAFFVFWPMLRMGPVS
ncbi:MAG: signal peptidase I [Planctomycetes bacterium]|nr:signal peptidase I [Planctomycetota bacterium]